MGRKSASSLETMVSSLSRGEVGDLVQLQSREAKWNWQTKRYEAPLTLEEPMVTDGSIKTAILAELGTPSTAEPALQFYRPGNDKEVYAMDVTAPFSLLQAFAFSIANIECDTKG